MLSECVVYNGDIHMNEKCPDCGSTDLIRGRQGNGMSKIAFTLLYSSATEHIICADCGLIIKSKITNIKSAKKNGKRIYEKED